MFCFFVSDIIIIIIIIVIICLNSNIFFLGQINTLLESGSAVLQTISAEKPDERMSKKNYASSYIILACDLYTIFLDTGNFRSWTEEECVRWVKTEGIFSVERHLQKFVEMYCRGGDFDTYTQSDFMAGGLPLGPAKHLFNAIQELIRSKDERGHIIYLYLMP